MPTSATSGMTPASAGMRHNFVQAEAKAKKTGSDEAKAAAKLCNRQLNELLLEIYQGRIERFPANLAFRFELGQQYKVLGQIGEAIKEFQNARNDARRKGVCLLQLGECFQAIKQYRLAMDHYESAIEEIPDRDADSKKAALYKAGKLALGLNDLAKAEKHLGVVASMDFSYRDVSVLLDKIAQRRDKEAEEEEKQKKEEKEEKQNRKDAPRRRIRRPTRPRLRNRPRPAPSVAGLLPISPLSGHRPKVGRERGRG